MTSATVRKWGLRLGLPVVVLAVLVVAGPFIYIHFMTDEAPPAFTLPAASATTDSTVAATSALTTTGDALATVEASTLDGKWTVTSGSQAGYRVKEVLFGQDAEAVGRTSTVSGDIVIKSTTVQSATITVDLASVKSGESRRDAQFTGRIMNTSTYPTATFSLTQPITLATIPADGVKTAVTAIGNLTLKGTTKSVTAELNAQRRGDTIQVAGAIPVTFADWNIANPSMAGISVQDTGTVEFLVLFSQA